MNGHSTHLLAEHMVRTFENLQFSLSSTCKCLNCFSWKLEYAGEVKHESATLEGLVRTLGVA